MQAGKRVPRGPGSENAKHADSTRRAKKEGVGQGVVLSKCDKKWRSAKEVASRRTRLTAVRAKEKWWEEKRLGKSTCSKNGTGDQNTGGYREGDGEEEARNETSKDRKRKTRKQEVRIS
ncbi:hypothetical protein Tco_0594761 [Tanacetum coccineum]